MRKPPKPGPVNDAIERMTSDDGDGDSSTDPGFVQPPIPADGDGDEAAMPASKPKAAPRGHPFKKGGKHKHGGKPFGKGGKAR
jgi:hypothetical protein